jgi:hypothetical protein
VGVGKTSLVAEAIPAWGRRFPAARWWLDLTAIREPDLVEHFLTDQLGLRPHTGSSLFEVLATRLAGQRALLVLDNCEHLLEVVARFPCTGSAPVSPAPAEHQTTRQRRSMVASHAWEPLSSIVTANIAGSIDLIDQPSTKAARSSACDTRRGPQSPGWRSLKHIR